VACCITSGIVVMLQFLELGLLATGTVSIVYQCYRSTGDDRQQDPCHRADMSLI
jgi:hypothetical protein